MKKKKNALASVSHIDRVTNECGRKILGGGSRNDGSIKMPPIKDEPIVKISIAINF